MVVEIVHATCYMLPLVSVAFYGALITCLLNGKAIQVWVLWARRDSAGYFSGRSLSHIFWVCECHPLLGVYAVFVCVCVLVEENVLFEVVHVLSCMCCALCLVTCAFTSHSHSICIVNAHEDCTWLEITQVSPLTE